MSSISSFQEYKKEIEEQEAQKEAEKSADHTMSVALDFEPLELNNDHVKLLLEFVDRQTLHIETSDGARFEETEKGNVLKATSTLPFQIDQKSDDLVRLEFDGDDFYIDLYLDSKLTKSLPDTFEKSMSLLEKGNEINLKIKELHSDKLQLTAFSSSSLLSTGISVTDDLTVNTDGYADLIPSEQLYRKHDRDKIPQSVVDSIDDEGFEKNYIKFENLHFDRAGLYFEDPEASRKQIQSVIDSVRAGEPIEPVVIDLKGNVVDGNHRMAAFNFLDIEEVPVYKSYFEDDTVFDNLTTRMQATNTPLPEPFFKEELPKVDNDSLYLVYQDKETLSPNNYLFSRSDLDPTESNKPLVAATVLVSDVFESNVFPGSDEEFNDTVAVAKDMSKRVVKISEDDEDIVITVLDDAALNPHLSMASKNETDMESVFKLMKIFDKDMVNEFRSDLGKAVWTKELEKFKPLKGNGIYEMDPFDEDGKRGVDIKIAGGEYQLDKFEAMEVNKSLHLHFRQVERELDFEPTL